MATPQHRLSFMARPDPNSYESEEDDGEFVLSIASFGAPPKPFNTYWLGIYRSGVEVPDADPVNVGRAAVMYFFDSIMRERHVLARIVKAARRVRARDVMGVRLSSYTGFEDEYDESDHPEVRTRGKYNGFNGDRKVLEMLQTGALSGFTLAEVAKALRVIRGWANASVTFARLQDSLGSFVYDPSDFLRYYNYADGPRGDAYQTARSEAEVVWACAEEVAKAFKLTYFHNPVLFGAPSAVISVDMES